jgi:hypothetical protein
MEINEENLFTEKEARLIKDIAKTLIEHGSAIALKKVENFKNHIQDDPVYIILKDLSQKQAGVNADSVLASFIKTKTKDIMEEMEVHKNLMRNALKKLDTLTRK